MMILFSSSTHLLFHLISLVLAVLLLVLLSLQLIQAQILGDSEIIQPWCNNSTIYFTHKLWLPVRVGIRFLGKL